MFRRIQELFSYKKVDQAEQERFDQQYKNILHNGRIMYAGTLLERAAHLYPDTTALICRDATITFKDLYKKSIKVSKRLVAMGVKPHDRVMLLLENSIEFYVGYYGIWQTGAVVAPLNTFLHVQELNHIINDAQPAAMIVADSFLERLQEIDGQRLPQYITHQEITTMINQPGDDSPFTCAQLDPDHMAALLYTSGTTGFPKGVMLSSRNILTNLVQGVCRVDVVPGQDKIYAALPLFHSFAQSACVWGSFFMGGTTVIVPKLERKLLLEALKHKPTVVAGVPALYGLFCLMRNVPFDHVRYFITGGDALPDKINIAFQAIYRRRLCNGYGLTETSPLIAINFQDAIMPSSAVGKVSIGIQCSLRDEHGNEVASDQKGILHVKGDNVMLGYYNAPEMTEKVLKNGWFNTGDWAYFDREQRLVIAGRDKDLIIHKGINIYPQEIENVIFSHPAIVNVAVVGKKDPDVGEVPVAFVVLKHEVQAIQEIIVALCKQNLAAYKIPKQVFVLTPDQLPLTPLKKIDKKRLRKEFLE